MVLTSILKKVTTLSTSKKEDDGKKNIDFKEGKLFGDWVTGKLLDEGGFGKVYIVVNEKDKRKAALKAESNAVEGGSAIKLEAMVLKKLNEKGATPHIPQLFLSGRRANYCYMIMTLLGPNLKSLREKHGKTKEGFSKGTWSRVGIQCLYAIKILHDHGFVHRDIKPQNFLLGNPTDKERARIVHILDFGLARPFATYSQANNTWKVRKARATAEFRGTMRYASPNVHRRLEQGRVDDIYSLLFLLVELNGAPHLPWQNFEDPVLVEESKIKHSRDAEVVMRDMPTVMMPVMQNLNNLDYYQKPNYHECFQALWKVMESAKVTPASKYDWETDEPDKDLRPAAWEHESGKFFKEDPLKISAPPKPTKSARMAPQPQTTDCLESIKMNPRDDRGLSDPKAAKKK